MIEDFQGKIINDDDVSLPKMEDYYYNSLAPIIDIDKINVDSVFFIEDPPDGDDAVGLSADGTMFIINSGPGYNVNSKKAAFTIPDKNIYTGMDNPYSLSFDISRCSVGENSQNQDFLKQLGGLAAYKNYLNKKYKIESGEESNLPSKDIKIRLLYVDGPQTPKYSIEMLDKKLVKKVKFSKMKGNADIHAQPFQAEFDRDNGALSITKEPAIRAYDDNDDIYIYNDVVQVWPCEKYEADPSKIKDEDIGYTDKDDYVIELKENSLKAEVAANKYSQDFFRNFSPLDSLGRAKTAVVCLSANHDFPKKDDERDTINTIVSAGYHPYQFDSIIRRTKNKDGNEYNPYGYLYNRCHLIAYSLSGEGENIKNFVTGTSCFDQAMFDNVEYVVRTWMYEHPDTKVLYKITPKYKDDELLPRSVVMEALSLDGTLDIAYEIKNLEKGIDIYYKTGEAWEHGTDKEKGNSFAKFYVMNTNRGQIEHINFAFRLRNKILNMILAAEDSRIVISTNGLNRRSDYKVPYNMQYSEPTGKIADAFYTAWKSFKSFFSKDDIWRRYSGFNMYGLDAYGRSLGVVYIKSKEYNGKWINLNKYIIWKIYSSGEIKLSDLMPDNMTFDDYYKDPTGERFKSWTYDIENINYQDNFWTQLKTRYGQDDRRKEIQKRVFAGAGIHPNINSDYVKPDTGSKYNCLKDWTISIGDVTFFCPPTAIRVVTQTSTERLPLLRAKGSMAKNIEKSDTELELTLFFNNEYGINGYELKDEPIWVNKDKDIDSKKKKESDEKATYYMNGLRALIAEFKFTPFLPIVNTFVNRTLNIAAVSLEQLDVETVPNFPKLLKATLRLKDFDYNIYMPEVPKMFVPKENEKDNDVENFFAQCVNYDVMRYYYQKPLQLGNELAYKLDNPAESFYSFNSVEFLKDTLCKNRTALMPCKFVDPNIDIYLANEDHLKKLLQIKKDAINKLKIGAEDNFVPDSIQSKFIANTEAVWAKISDIIVKYQNQKNSLVEEAKHQYHYGGDIKEGPTTYTYQFTDINKVKHDEVFNSSENRSQLYVFLNKVIYKYATEPCYAELGKRISETPELNTYIKGIKQVDVKDDDTQKWFEIVFDDAAVFNGPKDMETMWDQYCKIGSSTAEDKNKLKKNVLAKEHLFPNSILIAFNDLSGTRWLATDNNKYIDYIGYDDVLNFYMWSASNSQALLDANKEAADLKEAMDWENSKSVKFDLVAENVRVDLFQSSMANNFARVSLLDSDGYAPQYMGSSDIHIVWKIRTKDEQLAMIMKRIPEYEAYCMRKYHLVLPCFPIRIDSEFTRMLGVFEVSIEHTTVNTVPNYPGLYEIEVRAISVDRTLRNREALKSIDNKAKGNQNGQSGELDNKKLISSSLETIVKIRTFADLNKKIAQAEVYPDLELPTIGELGKKGFIFLRYKDKARNEEDLYVDPDFYFYYPYQTSADIIRAVIQANFSEKDPIELKSTQTAQDLTTIYSDNSGNAGVNFTNKDGKVNISSANDVYKKEVEDMIKNQKASVEAKRKNEDLELAKDFSAQLIGDPGKWDISTKLTCSFTESFYIGIKNLVNDKSLEDKIVDDKGAKDEERIKKLKELKEFYDNTMLAKNKAINDLYNYLKNNPIEDLTTESLQDNQSNETFKDQDLIKYSNFLMGLYISDNNVDSEIFTDYLKSVWSALTGTFEYNKSIPKTDWEGKLDYKGWYKSENGTVLKANDETDYSKMKAFGPFEIRKYTYSEITHYLDKDERAELIDYVNKFGPEETTKKDLIFTLDPYYRFKGNEDKTSEENKEKKKSEQQKYFEKCRTDINYAAKAYTRIILWWLIQLYKNDIFPSISLDVLEDKAKKDSKAKTKAEQLIKTIYGFNPVGVMQDTLLKSVDEFMSRNKPALDCGKIFCAIVMALYDQPLKDNTIYQMMEKRNYDGLNSKIQQLVSSKYKSRNKVDIKDALFRRFLLALCGYNQIKGPEYVGRSAEVTPASRFITNHNTIIALQAASDPSKYLFHSFYDMIRNDYRGRMLRAFPTFYCIFMDEGKEISLWKLHDNFYSINSIIDISIVKSRKIAADTCTLTLSNNYQTFITDDEDSYINYKETDFWDLWDSVFHEKKVADEAEERRLAAKMINRAKLQPGIRIHIKEGYGSDARQLTGIFNGVISEVQPNAMAINIVAQGNGVELMNPIMEDRDADEIQYKDAPGDFINNTEGGGASPHTILKSFLTTKNGFIRKYLQGKYAPNEQWWWNNGVADPQSDPPLFNAWAKWIADVWNKNAYGVIHFGDPDYIDTYPDGEIVQNIYEVCSLPSVARDDISIRSADKDNDELVEPPFLSFEPRGKTMWDVIHICQSVAPDYITGTASFGMRDTIFFGKPHYYYAYQYIRHNNIWMEQRKPFQQFHIIFSDKDIISNNITASSDNIKTVATGLYKDKAGWIDRNKDVGPLWVDKEIYPESQKSILVDTRLKMKDANALLLRSKTPFNTGWSLIDGFGNLGFNTLQSLLNVFPITGALATVSSVVMEDYLGGVFDDKGAVSNHKRIAWAATANALKNSIKEMYQGEITIIGSPSIKPNDRLLIRDEYNDMNGPVLVRDVVHNLNSQTGFTTTMHVDAISVVEDKDELVKQNMGAFITGQIALNAATSLMLGYTTSKGLGMLKDMADTLDEKVVSKLSKAVDLEKILKDAEDVIKDSKKLTKIKNAVGVTLKGGKLAAGAVAEGVGVLTGAAVTLSGLAAMAVPIMISIAITGALQEFLLSYTKNQQVLQIFPLRKNGMVYTAGLEGNMGLVYGSPTYGQFGPIKSILNKLFAPSKNGAGFDGFVDLLRDLFVSPEVQAAAAKYQRDYSYAQNIGNNPVGNEIAIETVSIGTARRSAFNFHKRNSFDLSLGNRVIVKNKDNEEFRALKNGLNRFYVNNIDDLISNSARKGQEMISQYNDLKPYISSKFLELLHDNVSKSNNTALMAKVTKINTVISNKKEVVNGIKVGANATDVPFLSKDALVVLKDIIEYNFKLLNIETDNCTDPAEIEKRLNGTKIIVSSALRIGEENLLCSSGYSFAIRGTGKLPNDILLKNINDYRKTVEERIKKIDKNKEVAWAIAVKGQDIRINIAPESSLVPENASTKQEDKEL